MATPPQDVKPNNNVWAPTLMPYSWQESYTDQHKAQIQQIVDWLNKHKKNRYWLAAVSRVNKVTLYKVMQGEYKPDPTRFIDQILDAIKHQADREKIVVTEFVETEPYRLAVAVCKRARRYRDFGIFTALVGIGKTTALRRYASMHKNTFLIECLPVMQPYPLIDKLIALAGITIPKGHNTIDRKLIKIIEALHLTETLIIADEAETITRASLEVLRRISDLAKVGVVLAGTEALYHKISPVGGEFDQIRSRVGMWPKTIRELSKADAEAIIHAEFKGKADLPEACIDRLYFYCKGSTRMLAQNLIPAVMDYGIKRQRELSPELIDEVALQVLKLEKFQEKKQ